MRKTSQDGGDTTSITESGIENETKRIGIGIMKTTRNSIKKRVQSLSHDSDEAVIEPLLQKQKPEITNQSAKYSILKTKTETATEKSSDKEKLISDDITKSSTSVAPSVAVSTASFHNYMNANKFENQDVKKVDVTNQGEVLVKIEGTKQNIYNPSPLIFTTAKIHTDNKNRHLEPVQGAPAPILSTIEGSSIKTGPGNDIEEKTDVVTEKDKNTNNIKHPESSTTVKEKQNIQDFPVEIKIHKVLSTKLDKTVNYVDQNQQTSSEINKVNETENSVTKPKQINNSTTVYQPLEQKKYEPNKSNGTSIIDANKNFPNISTSLKKSTDKKLNTIATDTTKKMVTQSSLAGSKQLQRQKNATLEDTCDLDSKKQSKNQKTSDSKILIEKTDCEKLITISKSMVKSEETVEGQKKTVSPSDSDAVKSLSTKSTITSSSIPTSYQYDSANKLTLSTTALKSIVTHTTKAAPITETTKVLSVATVRPFTNVTISSQSSIKAKTGIEIVNKPETATKDEYSKSTATPVVSKTSTVSSTNSSNGCISMQSLKQAEAATLCKSTTAMSANLVSTGVSSASNLKSTNAVKSATTTKSKPTTVMDTLTNSPHSLHSSHGKSFSNPTATVSSSTINGTKTNISSKPSVNKNSDVKKDSIKSSRA